MTCPTDCILKSNSLLMVHGGMVFSQAMQKLQSTTGISTQIRGMAAPMANGIQPLKCKTL